MNQIIKGLDNIHVEMANIIFWFWFIEFTHKYFRLASETIQYVKPYVLGNISKREMYRKIQITSQTQKKT